MHLLYSDRKHSNTQNIPVIHVDLLAVQRELNSDFNHLNGKKSRSQNAWSMVC